MATRQSSVPTVIFRQNSLSAEIKWLSFFLFRDFWGWGSRIIKKYPKLRGLDELEDHEERMKRLRSIVRSYRAEHKRDLQTAYKRIERSWKRIEQRGLSELSNIIGTDWPKKRRITAYLSLNPICPRFLDSWTFTVYFRSGTKDAIETVLHESSHFLFFKKWHELFPKTPRRHFDAPYLVWHFSEISAPVILNDTHMQKINRYRARGYREHERIRINGRPAPRVFATLYRQCMRDGSGFEGYMRKGIALVGKTKKLWK